MLPVFVINYTPFKERLSDTLNALSLSNLASNVSVVSAWDKEDLNPALLEYDNLRLWQKKLPIIYPVLAANARMFKAEISLDVIGYRLPVVYPEWAKARTLSAGEFSVLLKHYYAISSIAISGASHGLVFEDDVRARLSSRRDISQCIAEAMEASIDYLDLAGGCQLTPYADEYQSASSKIAILRVPRTRTVAAYMMSRRMAHMISNLFMPLIFPIDWHIQYIMLQVEDLKCGWTIKPPLIHGSEEGLIKSWRLRS